jgi:hypothetical protein
MQYLKQSTAITLKIGPFLDEDDGKTSEGGLSITQANVRISKNGGNIISKGDTSSCSHDELGIYGCPINATDTNTLGRLQLWVHEAGALPVWHEYMIVDSNVYDSLFGTDRLQTHTAEMTAGIITASVLASDAVDEIIDEVIEGSITLRQAIRALLAANAGKSTGGGTPTIKFRDNADSKDRISATVDSNGNRTAMTLNLT